jgi:hypothetical protein
MVLQVAKVELANSSGSSHAISSVSDRSCNREQAKDS